MAKSRIGILDGFRAIAIIAVLFFHYFTRWAPPTYPVSLYPYSEGYSFFKYGYLGVQFFFMISGFVIFYTLENTDRFGLFWKKRLIRLWPSIFIVTMITFLLFQVIDPHFIFPGSHYTRNLLPSFTFITPEFFNTVTSKPGHYSYINGVYWSLWPEIQFYLFVSILFFINKEKFLRNFIVLSVLLIMLNFLFANITTGSNRLHINISSALGSFYLTWILTIFNLLNHLSSFALGVLFYCLYKNRKLNIKTSGFIKIAVAIFFLFLLYSANKQAERVFFAIMFLLFMCFIYFPDRLSWLENKLLVRIGVCSYFLYLIHEHIAVLLINRFGSYFQPVSFIFTLLVMALLIMLSISYTEKIDKRINDFLKKAFLSKKPVVVAKSQPVV